MRADWKSCAELAPADYAAGAKRAPYVPREPVVTRMPPRVEPPSITITAEAILRLLQAAQQRESQPEPASRQATASQPESRPKINAQNGSD